MSSGAVPQRSEVTRLLVAWRDGDAAALDQLVPLVEAELRRLAHWYVRRERPGHLLQTTALVNEAFIRLVSWRDVSWQNRSHFLAMSARMRVQTIRRRDESGGGALQASSTRAPAERPLTGQMPSTLVGPGSTRSLRDDFLC